MPLMAGIAASLVLAWILIVTGLIGLVSAFAGRAGTHLGWNLASATLALVVGVVLLLFPLIGATVMACVIGAYLLFDGIALVALALDRRRRNLKPWAWLMASGVLDLALAAIILFMSAIGSAVLIGFVIGLSLVAAGVALLATHRKTAKSAVVNSELVSQDTKV